MTISAKYENGVFKPLEDVQMKEGTIVEVCVTVADPSGACQDDDVRLIEQVLAGRRVVVGGDGHGGAGRIHRAGKHVLVELVVGRVARVVAQGDALPRVVLQHRRQGVGAGHVVFLE